MLWLMWSISALVATKENSHCALCVRKDLVTLVSWVPHTKELQSVPRFVVRRRGHANHSCGKDGVCRSGTYPTGDCMLVMLDVCSLFWHYLYGERLYFVCCDAQYVWLRTISVPPEIFLFCSDGELREMCFFQPTAFTTMAVVGKYSFGVAVFLCPLFPPLLHIPGYQQMNLEWSFICNLNATKFIKFNFVKAVRKLFSSWN